MDQWRWTKPTKDIVVNKKERSCCVTLIDVIIDWAGDLTCSESEFGNEAGFQIKHL